MDLRAATEPWREIGPSDFVAKAEHEEAADAVILIADVLMDESGYDSALWTYYYRVLIRNERGAGRYSKIDIPYGRSVEVLDVEARTVKSDGSIQAIQKGDIFDKEAVRTQETRHRVKSFALVGVEPGVVLEYRWRERKHHVTLLYNLSFQKEIPVRYIRYRVSPYDYFGYGIRSRSFHAPNLNIKPDKSGMFTFEMRDLHPLQPEPFQPPSLQTQPTILIYPSARYLYATSGEFWEEASRELFKHEAQRVRVTKAVRTLAESLLEPGDPQKTKLAKLHDYCRTQIINIDSDRALKNADAKFRRPKEPLATDILRSKHGNRGDLAITLLSLARSVGLEARLAQVNDRTLIYYQEDIAEPFVFGGLVVAVKIDGEWVFCDPGAEYYPAGMLDWKHTGTAVLVANSTGALVVPAPVVKSSESIRSYRARLTLADNGELAGRVRSTATGYPAAELKQSLANLSDKTRQETILEKVRERYPLAEVSDVQVRNAEDPIAPIEVTYQIRIPGFAERTGTRLFFQPSVNRKNRHHPLTAKTRANSLVFPYLSREIDEILIELPEGYVVESRHAPFPLNFDPAGKYSIELGYQKETRLLGFKRDMTWDLPAAPKDSYPDVKKVFDEIYQRDQHLLTLLRDEGSRSEGTRASAAN